jgi:hypothetical protein
VPAPQAARRFFLRITVEDPRGRRLDLASLPHVVVDDLEAIGAGLPPRRLQNAEPELVARM